MNDFYVYGLIDNSKSENHIFYIGYGHGERVVSHYRKCSLIGVSHKNSTINLYRKKGYSDNYIIIADGLTKDLAIIMEIYFIAFFGRSDKSEGHLTNKTDGGEDPPHSYGINHHVHKLIKQGKSPGTLASISGKHNFIGIKPWEHPTSSKKSLVTWKIADICYVEYIDNMNFGRKKFKNHIKLKFNIELTERSVNTLLKYFKSGWNPYTDTNWNNFKKSNT